MGARLETLISESAESLAEELGLVVYDVQTVRGRRLVIRIRAERKHRAGPDDGITVAECATLSRRLEQALDLEEAVPERYALEVSSPGLERPLKTPRHFEGALGEWLRVTAGEAEGTTTVEGRLVTVEGDRIVLETGASTEELSLSGVKRADTVYRG